ncbi:nitroreductase family protein [Desulfovibrio sp. OttesenSCG-928-C06]|nr:nitroreductase family protein [Desulfovibrio sp. OttesenSCG-928-C06]
MEFADLICERYSVRKFSEQPVDAQMLEKILEAARIAPTAANKQPQRIISLESAEALEKLKACTTYHFNAPLALVVCYDATASWKHPQDGTDSGPVDASIIGTHIMLAVHDLGLGSTWVGYFDAAAVRREFMLPENWIPVAIFPIGHPAADSAPSPKHYARPDLGAVVYRK